MIYSPLTDNGINQAKKLSGHYDLIVISPLRRAKETLQYSSITYNNIIINDNFRERIFNTTDRLLSEDKIIETDQDFFNRVNKFHDGLESLCKKYENI